MSPDTIETRLAELRAEVKAWEYQIRAFAPSVDKISAIEERLTGIRRDLDALRTEVGDRMRRLHDEYDKRLQEEVRELHGDIEQIVDRRDREIGDLRKGIGDLGIAMQSMVRENRTDMMTLLDTRHAVLTEDISEIKANQAAFGADRTARRGQNWLAITSLVGSLLLLIGVILQAIFG